MPSLMPALPVGNKIIAVANRICSEPPFNKSQALQAALWLYFDELDRSHAISQGIQGPTGALWHGIMHRREGDFWNAKHWFQHGVQHPAFEATGYDPVAFVDEVEASSSNFDPRLVAKQRHEWKALFEWCLGEVSGER
ncbi:MAG: hypothetical protein QOJ65_1826 [Fimbriimonadaceae bacterium]|jgi:hypothetical protein|nr:hypothetical protein [Fimbriimonadaceae bacterium]